jgi:hypothetical protein
MLTALCRSPLLLAASVLGNDCFPFGSLAIMTEVATVMLASAHSFCAHKSKGQGEIASQSSEFCRSFVCIAAINK